MKSRHFFSRRLPFFGNYAMVVLCIIFFALPFMMRGARHAVDSMENKVADWLPTSFPETTELRWFRQHFVGDQFVVVSWDGCNESDQRFNLLVNKLKAESLEVQEKMFANIDNLPPKERQKMRELREAKLFADEHALHTTGSFHEDWSSDNTKWLMGKNGQRYFIDRAGNVWRWDGQDNIIALAKRGFDKFIGNERSFNRSTFVRQFGDPIDNEYYQEPSKLYARFFKKITTGPEIFEQLAGEDGTLRFGKHGEETLATFNAKIEAHKRLTGLLFGPTPDPNFTWTWSSFKSIIPESHLRQLTDVHEEQFVTFIEELVKERYDDNLGNLIAASQDDKLEHWYQLWNRFQLEPPPRQTCIIITLNDPVLSELNRAVGRPVLGKPRGRILELASGESGIAPENLHLGGPPVDNVGIDEEGSITLFRLVTLSGIIGITLAWLSFRSIRVTLMLFFTGGVAAMSSLAIVYFAGNTTDAILMTMPSLVYVLGLSGAVHIVNYYKDACLENGPAGAAETAIRHGWFPCTIAAFTTALGLISLYTSNLTPIKKFGLFSAMATLATVILLFSYLPASLTVWPPGYGRKRREDDPKPGFQLSDHVAKFWSGVCELVVRHNKIVAVCCTILIVVCAIGVTRVETNIQLLKLFRSDAKILKDYRWMEANLGKLVPMELVISVADDAQRPPTPKEPEEGADPIQLTDQELMDRQLRLTMLERMELSKRVREHVLDIFGPSGMNHIGSVMSADIAVNLDTAIGSQTKGHYTRLTTNGELEDNRNKLIEQDYLREEKVDFDGNWVSLNEQPSELWRISLRLAALNNVDYGEFISELKTVVEPILSAYRYRTKIVRQMQESLSSKSLEEGRILVLGPDPRSEFRKPKSREGAESASEFVDQTYLFSETLFDLLQNSGYKYRDGKKQFAWLDPESYRKKNNPLKPDIIEKVVGTVDCVVLTADDPDLDADLIKQHSKLFVDCRDHKYLIDAATKQPLSGMLSARQRYEADDKDAQIFTAYTGIVPIVYKAQRTLLHSLIESIGLAFVMIALVMMILLRRWRERVSVGNLLNVRGGLISMLPNVFPVVVIFGIMGHLQILVDIGSMMTASVAMGVAVDDTIHFLNWYRKGLQMGKSRHDSIRLAFDKVATAMTQTTLIAGLGLSAFAFSTFMPTQRFGIMMLFLLAAALVGDLVFLPALLAGPLGKYFGKEQVTPQVDAGGVISIARIGSDGNEILESDGSQIVASRNLPDQTSGSEPPPDSKRSAN